MNVLAIGCHPDDLEIGCGGTLARYAEKGHRVYMCHVANGDKGHAVIMPDKLSVLRSKEAGEAASVIGAHEVTGLGIPDLEVDSSNPENVKKLIDIIRNARPDIIITHSPRDYMKDHVETSKMVFDASFSSSVPHMLTQNPAYPDVVPLYYMDTLAGINFLPEEYVDISGHIDKKIRANNCHKSQIKWLLEHDNIDFLDFIKTVSKFRGLQCGADYAEGFTRCMVWPRLGTKRLLP